MSTKSRVNSVSDAKISITESYKEVSVKLYLPWSGAADEGEEGGVVDLDGGVGDVGEQVDRLIRVLLEGPLDALDDVGGGRNR